MSTTVLAVGVPAQGLTSLTSAVRRALAGRKFAGCALELFRRARFIDEVPVFGSRALRRGRARRVGQNAANQRPPSHLFASYGLPRALGISPTRRNVYTVISVVLERLASGALQQGKINSGFEIFDTQPPRGLLYTIP